MPVLTTVASAPRPATPPSASQVPSGTPNASAMAVAVRETSAERPSTSGTASISPPRRGRRAARPYSLDAKPTDLVLGRRRGDPVGELLGAGAVHVLALDHDHVVGVQQVLAALDQHVEVEVLGREERAPVRERVGLLLAGDRERLAHALAGLDVPRALRLDPGRLPERQLLRVRARLVSARGERRLGLGDARERLGGGVRALDMGRIVRRPDQDEVVVHHRLAARRRDRRP